MIGGLYMNKADNVNVQWMLRALELAERGRLSAPPNPHVGALVVRDGVLLGEGFHERAGGPHAEVAALKGIDAKGATLFVTLEPCAHYGRTPPCAKAVVESGIKKVFIGTLDPDERVRGKGVEILRAGGVDVEVGLLESAVKKSLAPYLHQRKTGLPYVVAKAAISIDGRIAHPSGRSQWISSEEAIRDAHLLRAASQAVMVGSKTALADNPRLTVRLEGVTRQPLRVVVDSKGIVKEGHLFDTTTSPTLIATTVKSDHPLHIHYEADRVPLRQLLQDLAKRGVIQLLVEGGAELLSALLEEELVHELITYTGPHIFGDGGKPLFSKISPTSGIELIDSCPLGQTVKSRYSIKSRRDFK